MATDPTLQIVEEYLSALRNSCSGVPSEERDEFVNEIRSHLHERIEVSAPPTRQALESILEATGRPQELAAQLKTQQVLRKASRSVAPWLLVRGMVRLAGRGLAGLLALLLAAAGYGCAVTSALTLVLKPFFPHRIGLWLSAGHTLTLGFCGGNLANAQTYGISVRSPIMFALGTLGADGPVREIAGPWVYLIAIVAFAAFLGITTVFSRWIIARSGVRRHLNFRNGAKMNPRYAG